MNTDQETTTTAGEAVEQPTVEAPEATTEQPAEAEPAKPVETAAPEPVTPKAVKEAPKSIGDDPLYKSYRRVEAKVERLTKLIMAQAKNNGSLTEEEQAAFEADEQVVKDATYTQIIHMAGKAGVEIGDQRFVEIRRAFNAKQYDEALELAKSTFSKGEKPVEEKMFTKADVMAMAQEEAKRLMDEERRKTQKIDPGLPSGGKRVFKQSDLADRQFWEANKEEILKAQAEGRIE